MTKQPGFPWASILVFFLGPAMAFFVFPPLWWPLNVGWMMIVIAVGSFGLLQNDRRMKAWLKVDQVRLDALVRKWYEAQCLPQQSTKEHEPGKKERVDVWDGLDEITEDEHRRLIGLAPEGKEKRAACGGGQNE